MAIVTTALAVYALHGNLAHATDPSVSNRVYLKRGVELKIGSQVVRDKGPVLDTTVIGSAREWSRNPYRSYRVEHINHRWLWIVPEHPEFGGGSGWVAASDVIQVDKVNEYFTLQIRLKPTPDDYLDRGIFREAKDPDLAIADYSEAIRLDPKCLMAYYNRGVAWRNKREYDKAITDYTEAIRLGHGFHWAYYGRGIAWTDKREYDRAITDFTEAIRLYPVFSSAFFLRGTCRYERAEYDQAIGDFSETLRLNPKHAGAYYGRARGWHLKKEYEKAIADYTELIHVDPKLCRQAYFDRANAFQSIEEYDKAIADLTETTRLDPSFALAHYNRAWLLASCPDDKVRNGMEALQSAIRACELTNWERGDCLYALAASYAETGNFEAAVKCQEIANSLTPRVSLDAVRLGTHLLNLYKSKKPFRLQGRKKARTTL